MPTSLTLPSQSTTGTTTPTPSISELVVLATLPASTWTAITPLISAANQASTIVDWRVATTTDPDATEDYDFRMNSGNLEIFSLVAETNLQITLEF